MGASVSQVDGSDSGHEGLHGGCVHALNGGPGNGPTGDASNGAGGQHRIAMLQGWSLKQSALQCCVA